MTMKSIRKTHILTMALFLMSIKTATVSAEEIQYRIIARDTVLQVDAVTSIPLSANTPVVLQEIPDDVVAIVSYEDYRGVVERANLKYEKKYVYNSNLNLRESPETGDVIVTMPIGSPVNVLSTENGWSKVMYKDIVGYCSETYLTNKHIIGSYRTPLVGDSGNRQNITVAANYINKNAARIPAGKTFSYLQAIGGESTYALGYTEATVLVNGKREKGMGGGVCQVSSTINAAIVTSDEAKSLIYVNEAHQHSAELAYIKRGLDATVWYPSLDFRITPIVDIQIETCIEGGYLYVNIIKL